MVRTNGLTHVALAVRDAERALGLYRQVLGVVPVYREAGFEEGASRPGERGGIAHFGFRLVDPADIDRAIEAVRAAGGTIREQGEFCPGEPYVFFTGPDGYEVEIWHELPTPLDP